MSYKPTAYPVYDTGPSNANQTGLSIDTKIPMVEDPSRTPSPTEAEFNYLNNIKQKKTVWQWIRTILPVLVVFTALIMLSVFHDPIVNALKPVTDWLQKNHVGGPLAMIGVMIIISFPPLLGHEIVAVLCGVAFEFFEACIIVSMGTVLGEVANYFVFKYACTARGRKLEEKNIEYGALAYIVRQGGFWIVLVIRFSAIPAHLATPVFSTVGMPFAVFLVAAILSLPKSFVPVYVGWALKPENDGNTTSNIISKCVLGVAILVTLGALWWVNRKMKQAKEDYIYTRRKARQAKGKGPSYISVAFNV